MTECNDDAIKLVVSTVVDAPQGSTFASAAPNLPTSRKNEKKLEEKGVNVFVDTRIPNKQIVAIDRLVRVGKLADALDVLKKETKKIDEDEHEDKVIAQSLNSGDEKKRGETAFVPVNYKVLKGQKQILPRPEDVMVAAPSQPRAPTRTTSERLSGSSNSNDTNNKLLVGKSFERERKSAGGKKSSNNTLFESVHKKIAVCKKQLMGSTNNDMNETIAITRLLMALLKLAETLDACEEELGHKEEVLGLINNNNSPLKLQHHHRPDPPMSPTLVLTTTSTTAAAATSSSPPSSHNNHSPPMSPNSVVGTMANTSSTPTAILKDRPLRSPNSVVTTSTAKSSSTPSVVEIAEQTISSSNSINTQGGGGWFPVFNSSVGGDCFISSSSSDSSSPSPITVATTTAITTTSGYNDDNTSSESVFDKLIQAEQIVASLALFKEHDDEYDDVAAAIKASFTQQRSLSPRSVMSSLSGPRKESHHPRKQQQQQQQQPMKASSGGITVIPDSTSTTDGNNVSTITISATNANMDGFNWIHRNMELCNKILMDSMNDFDEQTVELTTILFEEIGTDIESIEVKLVENQLYFF